MTSETCWCKPGSDPSKDYCPDHTPVVPTHECQPFEGQCFCLPGEVCGKKDGES